MLTATDTRVVDFYNFIQSKPKNEDGHYIGSVQNETGLLYVMGGDRPAIQVWLPADLLEYSNAAAGTSGSRAVGIRQTGYRSVEAAADEIVKIFSSPESLAKFISSSECDYTGPLSRKDKTPQQPAVETAKNAFWTYYTKEDLAGLVAKHGRARVQTAYDTLTLAEFEAQFNLTKQLTSA